MRGCAVMLLCLGSASWAAQVLWVPENNPEPASPAAQTQAVESLEFHPEGEPIDADKLAEAWKCSDINVHGANHGCRSCARSITRPATCPMCFSASRCRAPGVLP